MLRSFDPKKLPNDPFRTVGKLACAAHSSPFSMAVDRRGVAWINYAGTVYRVSILDGKCLQARKPTGAPSEFGMGFVSDGAERETLYVSGYNELTFGVSMSRRGPRETYRQVRHPQNPELSARAPATLGSSPIRRRGVQEIDRAPAHDRSVCPSAHRAETSALASRTVAASSTCSSRSTAPQSTVRAKTVTRTRARHLPSRIVGAASRLRAALESR